MISSHRLFGKYKTLRRPAVGKTAVILRVQVGVALVGAGRVRDARIGVRFAAEGWKDRLSGPQAPENAGAGQDAQDPFPLRLVSMSLCLVEGSRLSAEHSAFLQRSFVGASAAVGEFPEQPVFGNLTQLFLAPASWAAPFPATRGAALWP